MNTEKKKLTLALPAALYAEISNQAEKQATSVTDVIRQYLKLGCIAAKIEESENASLLIRENIITGHQNGLPVVETREQVIRLVL